MFCYDADPAVYISCVYELLDWRLHGVWRPLMTLSLDALTLCLIRYYFYPPSPLLTITTCKCCVVMHLVTSVRLCLSCSCSNFWKPWPRNFIFGLPVHPLEHPGHVHILSPPSPPLDYIRVKVIVWRLRGNITRTTLCWIVWHNVHSPQHTYVSSSYRSNR